MIKRTALALSLLWASSAGAATLDGVTLPDHYTVGGQSLVLNGIGVRTLFLFKIYVAGLYVTQPSHDASEILKSPGTKVLILSYLHSGSKAEVEKEYRAGEQTNCGGGGCDRSDAADFDRLVAAAPAVKVGDNTTYIMTSRGLTVLANNQSIGEYTNKDLAYRILEGFIGAHPPSTELKSELLGQPG